MAINTAPSAEDDLLLERQLCFALSVASRSVVGAYKPVLERLGLTHPQYLLMLALWEESPRRVRDLSETLLMEPATLSPMLKRLEAAGLVSRDRAPGDDRALAVELTDAGRALRAAALEVPGTMMDRLGLDRTEVEELNRSMHRLIAAAQAAPASAP
ncbi:MarR family transcriptional regulator [Arthrobacter sp. zg-Y411]|uniref:MarR family winged helix-turn-helix transcriptional regulator n=1 Tax=Arthrobacter TaxID=1663 RepID=UPI001D15032F|nr:MULTISPECIES: MarR family transcriptional regulator [Arthrobacter]MCC3296095.1 MarR family transcriptional regulator [Arthrobacter zhangbolii]MDN3902888.1 MarR family transcriptional regulator [Arthrobacter sp. YD2]